MGSYPLFQCQQDNTLYVSCCFNSRNVWISPFLVVWLGDGPDQESIVNQATGLFLDSVWRTPCWVAKNGIQLMLAQKMLVHLAILFAVEVSFKFAA